MVKKSKNTGDSFKFLFENSPIAMWEGDFSAYGRLVGGLKNNGISDMRKYLIHNLDTVKKTFRKVQIRNVNRAALALSGAKTKGQFTSHITKTLTHEALKVIIEGFLTFSQGKDFFEAELKSKTVRGKPYDVLLRVSTPRGYEKSLSDVIVTAQDITARKRLEHNLRLMAQQDSLTKLLNSRAISNRLDEELIRSRRYGVDLSCLMVDVDNFKVVNDKFGHQRGDQILKKVAVAVKNTLRRSDIVGRYGGDEFFVILTQTKAENAKVAAERIRKIINSLSFKSPYTTPIKVTMSIGISGYPYVDVKNYRDLIDQADKALYLAKASGRNCVVLIPQNQSDDKKNI